MRAKATTYTELIAALKRGGFPLRDKETTLGARKAWFDLPDHSSRTAMVAVEAALDKAGIPCTRGQVAVTGRGWSVEFQDGEIYGYERDGLFLSHTIRRPRGTEYRMGVDC